ncbi:MAG: hypothetical protein CL763_00955 [Chloroflexi bacterium]|nr:hypothetical protein [Chloroflexota bacterium]
MLVYPKQTNNEANIEVDFSFTNLYLMYKIQYYQFHLPKTTRQVMKFNLSLKDTHLEIIEQLKEKHSISSSEEIVKRYVKSALELQKDDFIFDSRREICTGGCFASEPQFEIDMDDSDFDKLRRVFENYRTTANSSGFSEYATVEEEISKTIRCIINFAEKEPDSISI